MYLPVALRVHRNGIARWSAWLRVMLQRLASCEVNLNVNLLSGVNTPTTAVSNRYS